MNIPPADLAIGMETFSTKVVGIDGRIKLSPDQFAVEEIIDSSLDFLTMLFHLTHSGSVFGKSILL